MTVLEGKSNITQLITLIAVGVCCPARAEIENLSANQNRKRRAVCRGNPPF